MPRATKAALAASNVVALPTAAPRQVNNSRYAAQRQARLALRHEQPWPGEHKWPHLRRQDVEDRLCATMERSPELLIVMTMFELMGVDQQQELAAKVASYAAQLRDDASAAAALITRRLSASSERKAELAHLLSEREGR